MNSDTQKVSIKQFESLFLLSYSDISSSALRDGAQSKILFNQENNLKDFVINLYFDIPSIDFHNMTNKSSYSAYNSNNNNLTKLNSKLRSNLFHFFTNENNTVWSIISLLKKKLNIIINVFSSGSLYYVKTIKYLICQTLKNSNFNFHNIKFNIQVNKTSYKWFNTFIKNESILSMINFEFIDNNTNNRIPNNHHSSSSFKNYFNELSLKFSDSVPSSSNPCSLDTILILTNKTGIKALLTILSDKPLSQFISSKNSENDISINNNITDSFNDDKYNYNNSDSESTQERQNLDVISTFLKRNSSSLINFQKNMITSNKDKSIKVESSMTNLNVPKPYIDTDAPLSFTFQSRYHNRSKRALSLIDPALKKPFSTLNINYDVNTTSPKNNNKLNVNSNNSLNKSFTSSSTSSINSLLSDTDDTDADLESFMIQTIPSNINIDDGQFNETDQDQDDIQNKLKKLPIKNIETSPKPITESIFEKNLINKSFELSRKSINNNNPLSTSNFNSKTLFKAFISGDFNDDSAENMSNGNSDSDKMLRSLDQEEKLMMISNSSPSISTTCSDSVSSATTLKKISSNLNIQLQNILYGSSNDIKNDKSIDGDSNELSKQIPLNNVTIPDIEISNYDTSKKQPQKDYKPVISLNLYGSDDNIDSNWMLGGNKL